MSEDQIKKIIELTLIEVKAILTVEKETMIRTNHVRASIGTRRSIMLVDELQNNIINDKSQEFITHISNVLQEK